MLHFQVSKANYTQEQNSTGHHETEFRACWSLWCHPAPLFLPPVVVCQRTACWMVVMLLVGIRLGNRVKLPQFSWAWWKGLGFESWGTQHWILTLLSFVSPFLGGQPVNVDAWPITTLVCPIPGAGPAFQTHQGATNPFHLPPPLQSHHLSSSSGPQPPQWCHGGHRAPGTWRVTHLAPPCPSSRGRASTAALAKLRANPCCGGANPSPASAHWQKCLQDSGSIFWSAQSHCYLVLPYKLLQSS